MKDILMITQFTQLPNEKGNGRFNYLADLISTRHNVELVTTNFRHSTKKFRPKHVSSVTDKYKITLIEEPGYNKNVDLKRLYSHRVLSKNIANYLYARKRPDLIYCSIPSIDVAFEVAKYASKNNIKFVIDIQDLWPEAFKMVFKIPIIKDFIFFPMKKKADFVYKMADKIIGVSETYINRALLVNNKIDVGYPVFLGTDLNEFDNNIKGAIDFHKSENELWIVYIGTLGHSYDLKTVIDAIHILKDNKYEKDIKFVIMGDGPLRDEFHAYSKNKEINIDFKGKLPYKEMIQILSKCDIAVNPIVKGSAGSIINKVGDYAASGLPVINSQESSEYRNLVKEYNIGFNVECENIDEFSNKLNILINDEKLRESMGSNNRALAEEKFDRSKTYNYILEKIIEEI